MPIKYGPMTRGFAQSFRKRYPHPKLKVPEQGPLALIFTDRKGQQYGDWYAIAGRWGCDTLSDALNRLEREDQNENWLAANFRS